MPFREEDLSHLLDNLMVNLTDVIYFKDLESRFIKVNEACAHKHGWESPEDAVGQSDFDLWSEEHAKQFFETEQRIIRTGEAEAAFEEREIWPDGHTTWVSSTKMPLRDRDGRIIGTFGISRDITLRKEAELRVRGYAEEIKAITEEMEDDIRMAGKLQKGFFSARYPEFLIGGFPAIRFLHRFTLNRQVTGDYCAFFKVSETEAGVFICDVSGIGIRAALGTALIRGVMQDLSSCSNHPGRFLQRMNELLFPLLQVEGHSLGASACYMVADLTTGRVRLANADHPMPIHFRQEYSASWFSEDEQAGGAALGSRVDVHYPEVELLLEPGDSVIAFTDGLYSVKNSMNDEYGCKRLLDSAHSWAGEPLEEVIDGLEKDALDFSKDGKFVDDVCLAGFTFNQILV